uniref:trypsin-like serine protease n=1 Tax=Staphylococcus aureus TaxID=1280 RepID=UPI0021090532
SVNPGNSGGAVVNREGKLIGVVAAKISMPNVEHMSFAIPVNEVQKIVKELETKGNIDYPDVGVKMKNIASLNSFERQAVKLLGKVLPLSNYIKSAEEHQQHLEKYPEDMHMCHISIALLNKYK